VALTRVTCPKCDTGLKSPSGFEVGQVIKCPKCKNEFEVEEPEEEETPKRPTKATAGKKPVRASSRDDDDEDEDDEEDDRPKKKKKKKRRDDDDEDAKSNVAFYIRLGVLLLIMIGLGVALIVLGPGALNK
jgi:uncharacterized Zn finger protein (UPF0148 family)